MSVGLPLSVPVKVQLAGIRSTQAVLCVRSAENGRGEEGPAAGEPLRHLCA